MPARHPFAARGAAALVAAILALPAAALAVVPTGAGHPDAPGGRHAVSPMFPSAAGSTGHRVDARVAAPVAATYTLVTSWPLDAATGVQGQYCPAYRPSIGHVGDIAFDTTGDVLVDVQCCGPGPGRCERRLVTVEVSARAVRNAALAFLGTDTAFAYDPVSASVLTYDELDVAAVPLPGTGGSLRTWNQMRASDATSNVPEDIAAGPAGVAFTFSPAGVSRYGPGVERFAPWPGSVGGSAAARPGSLFVDSTGRVYLHDPTLTGALYRFSSRGALDAAWHLAEPGGMSGPVAGFPGTDTPYVLHGDGSAEALTVRRLAPDGSTAASLPVGAAILPVPRPALAVAADGSYAIRGRGRSGADVIEIHAPGGELLLTVDPSGTGAPPTADATVLHVSAGLDGRILVHRASNLTVFDATGARRAEWVPPTDTTDAVLGPDGSVYVRTGLSSAHTSAVARHAEDGTPAWSAPVDGPAATGLAVSDRHVFATLPYEGAAAVLSVGTGERVGTLAGPADDVFLPDDFAVGAGDHLYALDIYSERVQVWDPAATVLQPVQYLQIGDETDTIHPLAIAAGPDGRIAVLEADERTPIPTRRVRVLDASGGLAWTLAAGAAPVSGLRYEDVAFDLQGRLVVLAAPVAPQGTPGRPTARVIVYAPDAVAATPTAVVTPTPVATPAAANTGLCTVSGDKRAEPGEVKLGEQVTVTLSLAQRCPRPTGPADIVLAVDVSGSMLGTKAEAIGRAVHAFIADLDLARHRLGVVTFATTATLLLPLTNDPAQLSALPADFGGMGHTNIRAAVQVAGDHLRTVGRSGVKRVIVLFTDGEWTEGDPLPLALAARREGIQIFAVGTADAKMPTLVRLAGSRQRAYFALTETELPDLYRQIASVIAADAGGVALDDVIGPDVALVAGSVSVPPSSMPGSALRWVWRAFATDPMTVTYRVTPLRTGWVDTNAGAWFDYVDADQVVRRFTYPVPRVLVHDRFTATPSATPTRTPTPPPTPTPVPVAIHLPVALRDPVCVAAKQRIDAVLVIDTSTSMRDPTRTGRTKIAAARAAASAFLDRLRLTDGDQAGIVFFSEEARLVQALTTDRAALDRALAAPTMESHTCLVCGVQTALDELLGPHHRATHRPAMIVLTDGLSNPRPASEAVALARDAKAAGVAIFTIGLGDVLDTDALREMASGALSFYQTPDAEQLGEIYAAIAVEIPCPRERFWGRR
jgi:Mg-chelatase subunit ChlD